MVEDSVLTPPNEKNQTKICHYGNQVLNHGRMGVVFLAGGLGSRVGGDKPKTCQKIESIGTSCLRHLVEQASDRGCPIAVMISDETEDIVRDELKGLDVEYFKQDSVPYYGMHTHELLGKCPTGHGAVYEELKKSNILEKWSGNYVDYIQICLSDNPALKVCDRAFIGQGALSSESCTVKVIDRDHTDPAGLVFSRGDNRHFVVDYRMAFTGSRARYGYTGVQMFPIDMLRLQTFALPWQPNISGPVVKYEQHVGDVLNFLPSRLHLMSRDQFSPIKNAKGSWSIESFEEHWNEDPRRPLDVG